MTKQVYVVGNNYRGPTIECFAAQGSEAFQITNDVNEADIFVFTGGADIDPHIYGQRRLAVTHYDEKRDRSELEVHRAIPEGKIKIGICRGAQLLNALNGGKMWQDVNNHAGSHHKLHLNAKGLVDNNVTVINSIHHQMMIPTYEAEVLGVAYEATKKLNSHRDIQGTIFTDPEVVWYKKDQSFCFQAHPEFGHAPTTEVFFKLLKHVDIF